MELPRAPAFGSLRSRNVRLFLGGQSDALWLSLALLFVTGFGVMVQLASSNALIQTIVADDRRGGVMGLYTMAFVGLAPAGTLLAGTLATSLGTARMVLLGGLGCLAGSLAFGRRCRGRRRRSERRSSAGLAGALEFRGFAPSRERFPRPRRGPSRPPPIGWLRLLLDRREHALGRERRAPHPRAGRREDRVRKRGEDRGRAGLAEARGVLG